MPRRFMLHNQTMSFYATIVRMLHVSPLLNAALVDLVADGLQQGMAPDLIALPLLACPLDERIHVLRFLLYREIGDAAFHARLLQTWRSILSPSHPLDSPELREALARLSAWWDAFGLGHQLTTDDYDYLEATLNAAGSSEEGVNYLQWIALHPLLARMDDIGDATRRGAIISLGRYGFMRPYGSLETALARHLDDGFTVQTDVVNILAALRSRLFARLANWYLANDPRLKPLVKKIFA